MTYASNAGPTDFATKTGLNIATPPLIGLPQATSYLLSNTVNAQADLSITKMDTPDPISLGAGNVTYTVTVTNAGPSPATNVSVADTLPGGVTFVSAAGTGWTCNPPVLGVVTCTRAALAVGAAPGITIVITPTATGMLTNNVSVTATEPDPTTPNSATATTTVNASVADFQVAVNPSTISADPGETVVVAIFVTPNPAPFSNAVALSCGMLPNPLLAC